MMTEAEEGVLLAVEAAKAAAYRATQDFLSVNGDRDCCGFAWVTVYTDGRSKVGRNLMKAGFKKVYGQPGLQMWNPSGHRTQALTAKEVGAEAAARVLRERLGVEAYSNSRMD
jgi:hypothetical protein